MLREFEEALAMTGYEIGNGKLVITGHLDVGEQDNLERALALLLEAEENQLVCDLSRVERISSSCLGLVGAFGLQAGEKGRRISVIASGRVYTSFREAGFGEFLG